MKDPLPDAGDEGFATQIVTGFVFFFLELFFDDGLCRDAGMIDARNPQRILTAHAGDTGEDVLERVIDGVAQVQRAGDIGRWDDDGVGLAGDGGVGTESVGVLPEFVDGRLEGGGVVGFGEILHGRLTET